jgi:hypothetical protein
VIIIKRLEIFFGDSKMLKTIYGILYGYYSCGKLEVRLIKRV